MKRFNSIAFALIILSVLLSCETRQKKGELLARQYCGNCHAFPDPGLLDKKTWEKGVLPQMNSRILHDYSLIGTASDDHQTETVGVTPENPMLTYANLEAIENYYLTNSPDSLLSPIQNLSSTITQFEISPFRLPIAGSPLITLVKTDIQNSKIYLGNRFSKLYQLDDKFILRDSFQLSSPPSQIHFHENDDPKLLLMGIMDPNDEPKGSLVQLKLSDRISSSIIDSIKRPVYFDEIDLNKDNNKDYVICAFGNNTGALLAYENLGNGKFEKHFLQNLPGARKVIVKDFDNNGLVDIMVLITQGDEKILLLNNEGNFNFSTTTLLRFPPVYGSSYFDIADFNNDGKVDILYSNGDNADYSPILKPYHGIRIFLNDGRNNFSESWFFNMHGASQAQALDFDNDGDLDIAAISFFPDFKKHPERSFIYFENTGKDFTPQITALASSGRWLTMDINDIDKDGDKDILLGSFNISPGVPAELFERWSKENASMLVLRNKLK